MLLQGLEQLKEWARNHALLTMRSPGHEEMGYLTENGEWLPITGNLLDDEHDPDEFARMQREWDEQVYGIDDDGREGESDGTN